MPTIDLSRHATNFRKHYDSVRMQQGRVLTDDDFNESERIDQEDERRTRVHVIGATGSPDGGFLIANAAVNAGAASFDIGAGTLYLGGLRLEMHETEPYIGQRDWLRADPIPLPPAEGRLDLVYVEAWQQSVSAVEDSELFEVALSGPDTSTRIRTLRRVRVAPGAGAADCHSAWEALIASWAAQGALNNELELVPEVTLTVGFDPGGDPNDLCSPPVAGGYLGAENQAIRVQLVDSTHFTWGYDNAAPLYRVEVLPDGQGVRRVIHMSTDPKDQAHWPLAGQVVEFLPWSAVLPNLEKVAELSGHLARVDGSYNPDTQRFTITALTEVPANFGNEWKNWGGADNLGEEEFLYMRVWNRGSDTASPLAIPFVAGTPVSLTGTGLNVTIDGPNRRANDFWVIAARPQTANRVAPWELEAGRRPHGYRRYYAPLAVIQWQTANGVTSGTVIDDCRETFPPLTRIRTCCTYTVGDGNNSYGHFTSIQEAIDHLPPDGGEVCVLPGRYVERVRIQTRRAIKLHGCGRRSLIVPPTETAEPLIAIHDSRNITVCSLGLESLAGVGVELRDHLNVEAPLASITVSQLDITVAARGAVHGRGGRDIRVLDNFIHLVSIGRALDGGSPAGKFPAIFLRADDVLIEKNRIVCLPEVRRAEAPLGGIQIGGGSERVEIRRNLISGGNGNGITLGSIVWVAQDQVGGIATNPGFFDQATSDLPGIFLGDDGCPHADPDPRDPGGDPANPLVPVSEGDLANLRISDNRIESMGMSGISSARFAGQRGGLITAGDLLIELNLIFDCFQLQLGAIPSPLVNRIGFGGIALADAEHLVVRLNRIERCGSRHGDPICGVFVGQGEGLIVDANEILENGPLGQNVAIVAAGLRGGIVVAKAFGPSKQTGLEWNAAQQGLVALRVHENIVISPLGPALKAAARGPVSVHGNQFTSRGMPPAGGDDASSNALLQALGGAAVTIANLGVTTELEGISKLGSVDSVQPGLGSTSSPALGRFDYLARSTGGNVLFNDNQVLLDTRRAAAGLGTPRNSILIYSLDDVSLSGNQSDCEVTGLLLTNTLVWGWTARITGNRFKEPLARALLSALTAGFMNSTVDNHGTHCVVALPYTAKLTAEPNHSLLFSSGTCLELGPAILAFLKQAGG